MSNVQRPQPLATGEGVAEKAKRKFKENPFVPIGALATTAALMTALVKMRRGQSKSFNNWLRVRLVAQGLTIAALLVGTYSFRPQNVSTNEDEVQFRREEKLGRERVAFEERLRGAEEMHRVETGGESVPVGGGQKGVSGSWWGSSTPSAKGSEKEQTPVDMAPVTSTPQASTVPKTSSTSGFWEKLGWGGSSKT